MALNEPPGHGIMALIEPPGHGFMTLNEPPGHGIASNYDPIAVLRELHLYYQLVTEVTASVV
jgi:hypothetical protein